MAIGSLVGLFALVLMLGEPEPRATMPEEPDAPDETLQNPVEAWESSPMQAIPIRTDVDFSIGPDRAPVTIVEFSDFQCPFCSRAVPELQRVADDYPDDVRIVFKNFPLDASCNESMEQQLHPMACQMAVMARCAGAQSPDLFWKMHDAIFADPDSLDGLPQAVGVEQAAFEACMEDGQALRHVLSDVELGNSLKLTSTPTVFVNGRQSPGYGADILSSIVDSILEQS